MSSLTAIREHIFAWGKRTYIMGVLNVTPDSFSEPEKDPQKQLTWASMKFPTTDEEKAQTA